MLGKKISNNNFDKNINIVTQFINAIKTNVTWYEVERALELLVKILVTN